MTAKVLTTAAGLITAGFGIWHFFVPKVWKWYSYIQKSASELVVAVRAVNFFFSLSLVIFGALSAALVWHSPQEIFSLKCVLGAGALLWAARISMQLIYPQGSISPWLQYGMLFAFAIVFLLYAISFTLIFKGA